MFGRTEFIFSRKTLKYNEMQGTHFNPSFKTEHIAGVMEKVIN